MLGRHVTLNRAIREGPMRRLQLVKHLKNNVGISERGIKAGAQNTKTLSRRLPGMPAEQQGQRDRGEVMG